MKILLVEDYQHTRKTTAYGLKSNIKDAEIFESDNGLAAVNFVKSGNIPDIILMDISMPVMNGIDAAREIKSIAPEIKIIMLTSFSEEKQVIASFSSGANAYCLKNIKPQELVNVINSVLTGAMWIDPQVVPFIRDKNCGVIPSRQLSRSAFKEHHSNLTQREYEVLKLVVDGQSNSQIAQTLTISEHTAKAHVCNIIQKLVVDDRTQAAVKALKEGLV